MNAVKHNKLTLLSGKSCTEDERSKKLQFFCGVVTVKTNEVNLQCEAYIPWFLTAC